MRTIRSGTAIGLRLGSGAWTQDGLLVAIRRSGAQQYFIDDAQAFTETAEALGHEARIVNVALDSNLAVSAMSDAIAAGADGIAIAVPDGSLGPSIAAAAAEAGVPLVATVISIADGAGNPVPFVGFDGLAMGEAVGDGAAGLLLESGWLEGGSCGLLNVELSTLAVCTDRTNATAARLIAAGAAGAAEESAVVAPCDGTTDSALSATGPILAAHPDVDHWVVYSCNDDGMLGAPNALGNAGFVPGDVIGAGLGAYEACRPWKEGLETGFRSALFASGRAVGEVAARVLADSIRSGGPLPAETIAPTQIVGPDTWEAIMSCG